MNTPVRNTVTLSSAVKAAAIDLGEDFTKVEATYNHYALRVYKKLNTQLLRTGLKRVILPVHKNFKTVALPLDFKSQAFVGVIDDCGYKLPLTLKTNITTEVEEVACAEKCDTCFQEKDICELLTVTVSTEEVTINGDVYTNTTTQYLENGHYYEVKKIWVFNTVSQETEELTTKKFLTEFDMLECGCIAQTAENIGKIKDNCYDCYCACYTPCRNDESDLGGYKIFEDNGVIQLDKNIGYDKIYMEYYGMLQKVEGAFHIPEAAFETIVYGIKHKATEHKKNLSFVERNWIWEKYKIEKNNLQKILGRMKLSDILNSFNKTPKFDTFAIGRINCGSGSYMVEKQKVVDAYVSCGGQVSPTPPPASLVELDFKVAASATPMVTGQSAKTITQFKGYNIIFSRGGLVQTKVNSGDNSYYTWNKDTAEFTCIPAAQDTEIFQIFPI